MSRLRDAGIAVYLIAGNHDAENRFFAKLPHIDNVRRFDHRRAHTIVDHDFRIAVHGRSFGQREVTDNIALDYPPPHPTYCNVGLLHTACEGAEGDHARYAPCSLEQLVNHGYEYWALGHVHARLVLHERPHVVYAGAIQGRHVREAGPEGVTLVRVCAGNVESMEHRDLDEIRWDSEAIDLSGALDLDAVRARARTGLQAVSDRAGERAVALRLVLRGETSVHSRLIREETALREDLDAMAATLPSTVYLE